jgi:hypothetical protein
VGEIDKIGIELERLGGTVSELAMSDPIVEAVELGSSVDVPD